MAKVSEICKGGLIKGSVDYIKDNTKMSMVYLTTTLVAAVPRFIDRISSISLEVSLSKMLLIISIIIITIINLKEKIGFLFGKIILLILI